MTEVPNSEMTYPQQTPGPNAVLSPGPGLAGMRDLWDLMQPSAVLGIQMNPYLQNPEQNGPCLEPDVASARVGTAPVWS